MKQQLKSFISSLIPETVKLRIDQTKVEKVYHQGYEEFKSSGQTPEAAYMAMINLYCVTNGKFNEQEHAKLKALHPAQKFHGELDSVIGKVNTTEFNQFNQTLIQDGYVNFGRKIPNELVQSIYSFAQKTPALMAPDYAQPTVYDPSNPKSEIYRFSLNDMVNNKDIQSLIMDPALIQIARNYLGCEPIFDFPAMWWSTAFLKEASSEAAQLYHFDMDRLKWLKIFIYLNDVTPENGPHRYIRGSHSVGAKPAELLKRGYARIPDEDLKNYYPEKDFIELNAPAGTIFAGDTKCWHKGTPLKKGNRLVLEFEYTSGMFGANYAKLEVKNDSPEFKKFCETNKQYAQNFKFIN
jgi:hypothetical protein